MSKEQVYFSPFEALQSEKANGIGLFLAPYCDRLTIPEAPYIKLFQCISFEYYD